MMNISGQDFIYGCSAIGAGLAMIAGIGGLGIRTGYPPPASAVLQWAAIRAQNLTLLPRCF